MKKIHFMGIGGAGTSAAASLAKSVGYVVDGCDISRESDYFSELRKSGVNVFNEHVISHLDSQDLIVVSAAISKVDSQNIELLEAKTRNIPVFTTEKFISEVLAKDKFFIAVSGTHGKSTTTAMIGQILEDAGYDPTVYVGAIVNKWGVNYRFGKSKYIVVEADEYEDKFLNYHPNIGVIANIEYDHPDYFKNEDQMVGSFTKFVNSFSPESKLILGTDPKDSENIKKLVENVGGVVSVLQGDIEQPDLGFELKVPGKHNQFNAAAAFFCAKALGIEEPLIKESLRKFSGLGRRLEFKDEVNNVKIFDDYAHHPTEILATLSAARERFPNEIIWCVFQPHTYSRTFALFNDFIKSLSEANVEKIILVDIYGAREKNKGNISSLDLSKKVKGSVYIGDLEEAAVYLAKNVSSGDVVINMGAGDIYKLSTLFANKLKGQNARNN